MFNKSDIKKAFNIKNLTTSDTFLNELKEWDKMYKGKASWLDKENGITSLRLEQSITREFSNISLNEMQINISNEKLKQIFDVAIQNINEKLQRGLATGAMIIKPLGADKVQYLSQNDFIPIEYDINGKLIKVIFPDYKKVNDKSFYTRLEYHELTEKGLTITNKAYHSTTSTDLGTECSLQDVEGWSNIIPKVCYPTMLKTAYGYFKTPIDNTIDNSGGGMSIFATAKDLIKQADLQFSNLNWEFESGQRAIHVDSVALRLDNNNKTTLPKLNKRLYKGLNIDGGNKELFEPFNPTLRESNIIAGLEEYKRNIEFNVGLSYGDISTPQVVEKTATEIKSAKKRKYNTINAIQKNLKECLSDLTYALAFYNLLTAQYDFNCTFKDSILSDESAERKQDQNDLAIGIIRAEEYRAKWYNETVEQALKNLPQTANVIS